MRSSWFRLAEQQLRANHSSSMAGLDRQPELATWRPLRCVRSGDTRRCSSRAPPEREIPCIIVPILAEPMPWGFAATGRSNGVSPLGPIGSLVTSPLAADKWQKLRRKPLVIGLEMFSAKEWIGGAVYLRNLVYTLAALPPAEQPQLRLLYDELAEPDLVDDLRNFG